MKGKVIVVILWKAKNPDYTLKYSDISQDYFSLRKM